MQPSKFVVKEVGALIKDAIEKRVGQFLEPKQAPSKQRNEPSPENPLCIRGQTLRLAAYFIKRHINLRCIIRQHCRGLRVFPERFVVCASLPENATTSTGNLSQDMSGQSRSGYFSGSGETLDLLNSSTITKRAALQKIARQADAHPKAGNQQPRNQKRGPTSAQQNDAGEGVAKLEAISEDGKQGCSEVGDGDTVVLPVVSSELDKQDPAQDGHRDSDHVNVNHARRKRGTGEDFTHQEAKRICLEEADSSTAFFSTLGPSPKRSAAVAQAEHMLEEELLTHGKQAPRLPLSTSPAKQTNQSRLAASLRGLSVKPVSSGSSISSRSAAKEEEKPTLPRISRIRRLKKS